MTSVDTSPEQIAMRGELSPRQDWRIMDMRTHALGRTFNGVLAWDSYFHLCPDDQRQKFPIFCNHAASGAALMFTGGAAAGVAMCAYVESMAYALS